MNKPQEQITESGYFQDIDYWEDYACQVGGIEVCDDQTGEVVFAVGV